MAFAASATLPDAPGWSRRPSRATLSASASNFDTSDFNPSFCWFSFWICAPRCSGVAFSSAFTSLAISFCRSCRSFAWSASFFTWSLTRLDCAFSSPFAAFFN